MAPASSEVGEPPIVTLDPEQTENPAPGSKSNSDGRPDGISAAFR